MKHLVVFISLISFGLVSQGQITWDNPKPDTVYSFETNADVEVHNNITFSDSGTYRWVRKIVTNCTIANAICDKNQCYLEHVDSAIFHVNKNESFQMICHFYPYDKCCKHAKVILKVYQVANPTISSIAEYNISLWCSKLSAAEFNPERLQITPNPVQNVLTLSTGTVLADDIQIISPTGKVVLHVDEPQSEEVDVSNLPAGIYMISAQINGILVRKNFLKL